MASPTIPFTPTLDEIMYQAGSPDVIAPVESQILHIQDTIDSSGTSATRKHHSAIAYGGRMIVFGGTLHDGTSTASVAEYNFDLNEWSLLECLGDIPQERSKHSAVLYEGNMYIFGGLSSTGVPLNDMYALTLDSPPPLQWRRMHNGEQNQAPTARCLHSASVVSGRMYIFGGYSPTPNSSSTCSCGLGTFCDKLCSSVFGDMWEFSFAGSYWTEVRPWQDSLVESSEVTSSTKPWPSARYSHACATSVHDTFFVCGGSSKQSEYLADIWEFDSSTYLWKEIVAPGPSPHDMLHPIACCSESELIILNDENTKLVHVISRLDLAKRVWTEVPEEYWHSESLVRFCLHGASVVIRRVQRSPIAGQPAGSPSPMTILPTSPKLVQSALSPQQSGDGDYDELLIFGSLGPSNKRGQLVVFKLSSPS